MKSLYTADSIPIVNPPQPIELHLVSIEWLRCEAVIIRSFGCCSPRTFSIRALPQW